MATVQELLVKITGDASGFKKAIDETKNAGTQVGNSFQSVGTKMTDIGKTATAVFTVPIAGAAAGAVKNFAEVDKTMSLTNQTMGNSAQEAKVLEDAMKSAASNSVFGMGDAANASLNFARAGLDAQQAAEALAPAMNLAAGEGGNLDTVSGGLVSTINGFHGSFDQAGQYADVFANACNNSALDVDSLSNAMSVAAPIFSSAGYNVNDAALYMGVMANNGIEAEVAANSLKTGIARLVSPAKEGADMMEQLGLSVTNADGSMKDSVTIQQELHDAFGKLSDSEQIAAASAIFGKDQMAPWLALINTAPSDVQSLASALEEEGTTAEMASAMQDGFGGSLEKLKSSVDVAGNSFGEALSPAISTVADAIQDAVDWFNSLDDGQQQTIGTIALVVAAIGPAIAIFGQLSKGVGGVINTFGKISGAFGSATSSFGSVGKAASQLGGDVGTAGSSVGGAAPSFGSFAGEALKMAAIAGIIIAVAAAVTMLVDAAIKLYSAGPGAIATFAGLTAAGIAITAAIAAIGSACTASAPGLLALGAAVLMVSTGIAAIIAAISLVIDAFAKLVDSVTKLCDKLPLISEHGEKGAKGLAQLALGVAELGLAAGIAALPIAALDLALAAFDATAGLATPIVVVLTLAIAALDLAMIGLAASLKAVGEAFSSTFDSVASVVKKAIDAVVDTVSGLVEKVIKFFKDLKYKLIGDPIVLDMVNGIIKGFTDLKDKAVKFVLELKDKVIQFFTDLKDKAVTLITGLRDRAVEKFEEIKTKIVEKVTELKDKAVEKFNEIKDKIVEKVTDLKDKAVEKFNEIKDKIVEKVTELKEKAIEKVTELKDKAIEYFEETKTKVIEKVTELKEKAQEKFTELKEKVTEAVTELKDKIQEKFTEIKDKIQEKVTEAKEKAQEKFTELKDAVIDKMRETVENVAKKITEMVDKFKEIDLIDIGKNIISGFLNGLKSGWDAITKWVDDACDSIKKKFKKAMKIASPSKVFKEYGNYIDQGLVLGLQGGYKDITREVSKLTNGVNGTFTNSVSLKGGGGALGATTINLNGDYMFQDKASMDYFLNRMQLAIQRVS